MPIQAMIRLQDCKTNRRRAFVPKGETSHGIARGTVHNYQVTGFTWAHIRRVLKLAEVMGHSNVHADSVDSWTTDSSARAGRLVSLSPGQPYLEVR